MPVFDTLKAVKSLKAAGFDELQAEAVVSTVGSAVAENLVTKADLDAAKADLDATLRRALEPMVTRKYLQSELQRLQQEFQHLQLTLQQKMTIRLGGMLIAGIGALAVLIGLF